MTWREIKRPWSKPEWPGPGVLKSLGKVLNARWGGGKVNNEQVTAKNGQEVFSFSIAEVFITYKLSGFIFFCQGVNIRRQQFYIYYQEEEIYHRTLVRNHTNRRERNRTALVSSSFSCLFFLISRTTFASIPA
jgi:hypothetical protein